MRYSPCIRGVVGLYPRYNQRSPTYLKPSGPGVSGALTAVARPAASRASLCPPGRCQSLVRHVIVVTPQVGMLTSQLFVPSRLSQVESALPLLCVHAALPSCVPFVYSLRVVLVSRAVCAFCGLLGFSWVAPFSRCPVSLIGRPVNYGFRQLAPGREALLSRPNSLAPNSRAFDVPLGNGHASLVCSLLGLKATTLGAYYGEVE